MMIRLFAAMALAALVSGAAWAHFGQSRFQVPAQPIAIIVHPIGIAPTVGSIADTASAGTPIVSLMIVMSDGSPFSGTLTAQDGTGIVCSVSPCTVDPRLITARQLSATDDGSHTIVFTAATTGQPLIKTFTLTVTPAGIACDFGPNYTGTIPAGATAAGFTHCAANFDFAQFSNVNQFIECFGASNPILYQGNDTVPSPVPCDSTHYAMVNDGGVSAFKSSWLLSDGVHIPTLRSASTVNTVFPAYIGFTVPNGMFLELTWRLSSVSQCSANCLTFGPFQYTHSSPTQPFFEVDYDEVYTGPGGTNHQMGTNAIGTNPPGAFTNVTYSTYDPTHYHTYGVRVTADGNGHIAFCNYYSSTVVQGLPSGTLNGCNTNSESGSGTSKTVMIFPWGPNPNDVANFNAGFDMYFQRVTLWECPGWRNANENNNIFVGAQCNGTLLTSSP